MNRLFRNSIGLFLLLIASFSFAQKQYPVKWVAGVEQNSDGEATLVFTANIEKGWHIFSQFTPEGGSLPMVFTYTPSKGYELKGKTVEPKAHVEFDKDFKVDVWTFTGSPVLKQKIKVKSKEKFSIEVKIEYQACIDQCIFADTTLVITVNENAKGAIENTPPVKIKHDSSGSTEPIKDRDTIVKAPVAPADDTSKLVLANSPMDVVLEAGCGTEEAATSKSIWGIFIAGMLGGLLALVTPCVFPMIPLTVSFFTKRSGTRKKGLMNALIYASSIIVIYVSLGFLITVTLGSDALNDLSTNGYFNMSFFIIFIIFAISFFGVFEITLPSSLVNKADSASERGGLIGIFFMAFTLSLVSFSCTGPIIGTLLVEAANGSYLGPLMGMFGFSFAHALPFALFSMFPGWLSSLPKSGGWLNTVKVCLGFIELALAMKFFSNVDLAYHWGALKRELFLSFWIIIFTLMGMYLIGKIHFSHDTPSKHLSVGRLLFAILTFTFTLYLIPGLWGASLKLISGFPPPMFYKEWSTGKSECPLDIQCFHNQYEEGMAYAKKVGKPALIDFTGWNCANCRRMEENIWPDPEVFKRISDKYVLISLYVDDKGELPATEDITSKTTGKKITVKTLGKKFGTMQSEQYNTNAQPYYVLLDNHGKILAKPRGNTPDPKLYTKYLDEGLCRYKARKDNEASLKASL